MIRPAPIIQRILARCRIVTNRIGSFYKLRVDDRQAHGDWGVWLESKDPVDVGDLVTVLTRAGKIVQVRVSAIIAEGESRTTGKPFKVLAITKERIYPPGDVL